MSLVCVCHSLCSSFVLYVLYVFLHSFIYVCISLVRSLFLSVGMSLFVLIRPLVVWGFPSLVV